MAWEARSGLKQLALSKKGDLFPGLNGLGSPFGIVTKHIVCFKPPFQGLNALGCPVGIEA